MDRAASSLSRRNMLIALGGIAVAGVAAASGSFAAAGQGTRRLLAGNSFTRQFLSLASADMAEWADQVGSVFEVDGGYRLKLAGVQPLLSEGERPSEVTRERAFLAVFEVLDGAAMSGDLIYTAHHPQYGSLPLFLAGAGQANRMHAVFN